jgi:hypothetical protein
MAKLSRLRRAFERAERERVDAAYVYNEVVKHYRRLRSPRSKYDAYWQEVVPAYEELQLAIQRREQAAAELNEAELGPMLPPGTEFELTATTRGGTPRRSIPGAHDTAAAKRRRRQEKKGQ